MRVYTYVIVVDRGSAPNYDAPFVTLAVCKPRIRRSARVGDLVLAFTGKSLGPEPHAVRWAGVVSEKLSFAEYWRDERFQGKKPGQSAAPDNIYRPGPGGLVQVPNSTHDQSNVARDLVGEDVLIFDRAWRFDGVVALLPRELGLRMDSRRGHRVFDLSPAQAKRLLSWLDREAPPWKPPVLARVHAGKRCSPAPKRRC